MKKILAMILCAVMVFSFAARRLKPQQKPQPMFRRRLAQKPPQHPKKKFTP